MAGKHSATVKRINGTAGIIRAKVVAGGIIAIGPNAEFWIIGKRCTCTEKVHIPTGSGISCLRHRHNQAFASGFSIVGKLCHHKAVGDVVIKHNGVTQSTQTGKVVQVGLVYQRSSAFIEDAEIGTATSVDHLNHMIGTCCKRRVGWIYKSVAQTVDVDPDGSGLTFRALTFRLQSRVGCNGTCIGCRINANRPFAFPPAHPVFIANDNAVHSSIGFHPVGTLRNFY